jgi:protein-arginine kinase activator protein McsA
MNKFNFTGLPFFYYAVITSDYGLKSDNKEFKLRKKIYAIEAEMDKLIANMDFEGAIEIRDSKLKEAKEKLENHLNQKDANEKVSVSMEELKVKLEKAIENEDYEKAAQIRDKLKDLNQSI